MRTKTKIRKPLPLEREELVAVIQWASYYPTISDHLIRIENEGKRSWYVGKQAKKEGLKAGVSDLFLAYPKVPFYGLWIELKRNDRRAVITEAQLLWLERMKNIGYQAHVAYGADDAIEKIKYYMRIKEN